MTRLDAGAIDPKRGRSTSATWSRPLCVAPVRC
jgi:hypothetical protein